MALADIPGYGAYVQRRQMIEGEPLAQLQQAQGVMGLQAAMEKKRQDEELRTVLAQSGGDVEKAVEVAVRSGNVGAAHQLAPLAKLAQERRQADETRSGLAALAPQGAGAAPGAPMELGAGQPIRVAGEDAAPTMAVSPQARIDHLNKLSILYANNPVVMQRLQAEIDNVQKQADKAPTKRDRIAGSTLIQEELQPGGAWKEIGRGPRFASGAAAGEAKAGLSEQYTTDETYKKNVNYWAALLANGGTLPPRFAQSGAGKKMMPDILNVVPTLSKDSKEMLAAQVDLTGQKSEARSVGTRAAAVEMAAGEAREMMPILMSTSENFSRTGYQPINKVFKSFQDNTGSVESRQFGAALNSFVNVYARAVSPSGVPTVSDKDHAREVLSTADSHEQLVGLLKVLDQEMVAAQNAPKRVREAQRSGITGQPVPRHGPPAPKNAKGWNLMQDANGNMAYVGPNREVEEVK